MIKITGMVIKPGEGTACKATINQSVDGFRKALGCDGIIDLTIARLDGRSFVIANNSLFAMLDPDTLPSAFEADNAPVLYGNLFICRHDDSIDADSLITRAGEGEINEAEYMDTLIPHLIGLSDDDIALILSHCLVTSVDSSPQKPRVSLRCVGYRYKAKEKP